MKKLLLLPHWAVFLLVAGLPFLAQIAFSVLFVFAPFNTGALIPLIVLPVAVSGIGTMLWAWSAGTQLHAKLPENVSMNVRLFKAFLIFPAVYLTTIFAFSFLVLNYQASPDALVMSSALIFPLHLFAMFCIFYCIYFIGKSLKAVEVQDNVTFSDYAGEFFLTWFFPVGVWFIQPRLNKIFAEKTEALESDLV